MKIGGFVKQSLIDYPGKIAGVIFTQGCNFRCGYCHNPQLVLPGLFQSNPDYAPSKILNYLEQRRQWLDGVVITGGEPTIHHDLPEFLKAIKAFGYHIKLDTNGSNPYMLQQIINENLVDYVAMDIKFPLDNDAHAGIIGLSNMDEMTENILASVIILKNTSIDHEFRTTYIPGIHNDLMIDMVRKFIGGNHRYQVNDFRDGNNLNQYAMDLHG